jgi:hypothetical protein
VNPVRIEVGLLQDRLVEVLLNRHFFPNSPLEFLRLHNFALTITCLTYFFSWYLTRDFFPPTTSNAITDLHALSRRIPVDVLRRRLYVRYGYGKNHGKDN